MSLVIKWWLTGAVVLFAFALATPDYLVDKNWNRDFASASMIGIGGLSNIFTASKNEAADRVGSVRRWFKSKKEKIQKKKRQ